MQCHSSGGHGFEGSSRGHGFEGSSGGHGFEGSSGGHGFEGSSGGRGFEGSSGGHGFEGNSGGHGFEGSSGGHGFEGNSGGHGFEGSSGGHGFEGLVYLDGQSALKVVARIFVPGLHKPLLALLGGLRSQIIISNIQFAHGKFNIIQGLLYHRTCIPDSLCSWPSLNSYLK